MSFQSSLTKLAQAHQHTANADDYLSKGLIVLAAEEHFKAAEAYLAAIDRSHDESVEPHSHVALLVTNALFLGQAYPSKAS